MFRCEEGVNNFRDFQKKSLQHQWWMKGAAATILAIISFIGWSVDHAIDKVLPAAKVLIEYYDKTHPDANIPKISHTFPPEQKYPVPTSAGNESRQP